MYGGVLSIPMQLLERRVADPNYQRQVERVQREIARAVAEGEAKRREDDVLRRRERRV